MVNTSTLTMNRSRIERFVTLQVLDLGTTLIGFCAGCAEANPAINHFFPTLGPLVGLFVGKLLMVSVILGFMLNRPTACTDKGWKAVNSAFTVLIVWNIEPDAFGDFNQFFLIDNIRSNDAFNIFPTLSFSD